MTPTWPRRVTTRWSTSEPAATRGPTCPGSTWSASPRTCPRGWSAFAALKNAGDRDYIVYEDERLTYGEADALIRALAARLVDTYGVEPGGVAGEYFAALLAHSFLREWEAAALAETAVVEIDEPRVIYRDKLAARGEPGGRQP